MSSVCPQNRCSASLVQGEKRICEKMHSMIHLLLWILLIALSVAFSEEKREETQRGPPYWRLFWSLIWAPWNCFLWHLVIQDQGLAKINKKFSSMVQHSLFCNTWGGAQMAIRLIMFITVCKSSSQLCSSMACRQERNKWRCLLGKSHRRYKTLTDYHSPLGSNQRKTFILD